jgi:hypothetical protein
MWGYTMSVRPGCVRKTDPSQRLSSSVHFAQAMGSMLGVAWAEAAPAPVDSPAPVGPLDDLRAGLGPGSLLLDEVLLSPLLGNKELASLSRSATWLLSYRMQLISVKITGNNAIMHNPTKRKMLSQQRQLQHIEFVAAENAWPVMDVLREGPGRTVRSLKIPPCSIAPHRDGPCSCLPAGSEVGACLEAGGCPVLETLHYGGHTSPSLCNVVRGLVGCPRLLELRLTVMTVACGDALAAALAEGAVPELRHLDLTWGSHPRDLVDWENGPVVDAPQPHGVAMARVLQASPRPKLRVLSITFYERSAHDDEGVVAVVEALKTGTYRGLASLSLGFAVGSPLPAKGLEALGEALAEGAWPHLESLDMQCTVPALARLVDAIRWGMLPCLQHLDLLGEYSYSQGVEVEVGMAVGRALRAGRCRWLQTLMIPRGSAGCEEIARAMAEGALPCLSVLRLPGLRVPRVGGQALVWALEGGAGANLIEIELDINCRATWTRLRAVVAGACPKMRRAHITANYVD